MLYIYIYIYVMYNINIYILNMYSKKLKNVSAYVFII